MKHKRDVKTDGEKYVAVSLLFFGQSPAKSIVITYFGMIHANLYFESGRSQLGSVSLYKEHQNIASYSVALTVLTDQSSKTSVRVDDVLV